jgi:hypothetical protein
MVEEMGRALSTLGRRNAYEIVVGKSGRKRTQEGLGINGRTILTWI